MLARPPAKAIYRPPTSIFRPAHITFSIPLKHLYHSTPEVVTLHTSQPPKLDQYWLPF